MFGENVRAEKDQISLEIQYNIHAYYIIFNHVLL